MILAEQVKLESEVLEQQRDLLIKLPELYADTGKSYPVLYVLHGQWDMLPTLSVIDLLSEQVPNFIVVGIESRGSELKPNNGDLTAFGKFLIQELKPFIDKNYRTSSFSILSGHSNSGRFVLDSWLNGHADFSQYFAFSPSLDDEYIVKQVKQRSLSALKQTSPLIVTIANEGEHMQVAFSELNESLAKVSNSRYIFQSFPEQSHRTTKHSSMQFALKTTFSGWQPSYEIKVSGIDVLAKYYQDLSHRFGFQIDVPNGTLQRLVAHYATSENQQIALSQHVAFAVAQTAGGTDSMFEIADYLLTNNYQQAGQKVIEEICNQVSTHVRCKS
ncbi:alpha/beta hydrolase [Shewanella pneumatophori]|uniref:Esterase n=1 Tax=Shewanella pneumatophori TaxID=314092 RepID=A0A9X1ZL04_9GAMM|nr:alpha/beta hydrolase-fold protein [Shewanella pneumatophori]MCL1139768.1 esterase [Shewanella pneumatophori]